MTERIDDFSRKLASGMSRRKAFWQLLTGAGGLALLTTQKASADSVGCPSFCFQQASYAYSQCSEDLQEVDPAIPFIQIFGLCLGAYGQIYQFCLTQSATCPAKMCTQINYTVTNGEINVQSLTCVTA
jgi:hypothetical protein